MIIHIFPDTDSTLYEVSASMNTGIDQVLELEKVVTKAETPKVETKTAQKKAPEKEQKKQEQPKEKEEQKK